MRAFESGTVPENWKNRVIVLLYKIKDECKNCRGTSLPSVVKKVFR